MGRHFARKGAWHQGVNPPLIRVLRLDAPPLPWLDVRCLRIGTRCCRLDFNLIQTRGLPTVKNIKSIVAIAAAASGLLGAASSQAGVIFSDNFDADATTSSLNFNSLINWMVDQGTIDYIRSGGFGIGCAGGTGGCIDTDGSSGDAGRLLSKQVFTFTAGVSYYIDMLLSGNQRNGAADSVDFGLVDVNTGALIGATVGPMAANSPFSPITGMFLGSVATGSYRLYVAGVGNDNVGAILDNFVLRDNTTSLPEPGTLALAAFALLGAVTARRRRVA